MLEGQSGLVETKNEHFDLLIVDRILPDGDGVLVVDSLRKSGFTNPVLMLTALGSIEDRVEGLRHGADDYLVKPFAQAELLARIDALFRRSKGAFQDVHEYASITINRRRREARRAGQRIMLQPRGVRTAGTACPARGEICLQGDDVGKRLEFPFPPRHQYRRNPYEQAAPEAERRVRVRCDPDGAQGWLQAPG